jgi:hypothetical protein
MKAFTVHDVCKIARFTDSALYKYLGLGLTFIRQRVNSVTAL